MVEPRKPLILDLDTAPDLERGIEPAEAPPIEDAPDDGGAGASAMAVAAGRRRRSTVERLFWLALTGLVVLGLGLALDGLVSALFERAAALGWIGVGLVALLLCALVGLALAELAGIARLGRIDAVRRRAETAHAGDAAAAKAALSDLARLMRSHPTGAAGIARLDAAAGDAPDPVERLALAETLVMKPLDAEAAAAVVHTARRIAAITAVVPMPVLDVALILWSTLGMVRRVAEAYGGRAGWLGSWRLMKAIATQLVAAGVVSSTEDLLDPVLGQGIAGRLSKRLGEAAFNAALTTRVGVVAMTVCRPLPFAETPPPRARTLLLRALGDWSGKARTDSQGEGGSGP